MDYYRRIDHFGDFILLAWSNIEVNLNLAFLIEFGTPPKVGVKNGVQWPELDERGKFLLEIPLSKRIDFLKHIMAIKKDEISVLSTFQSDRNRYFHGKEPPFIHLSEDGRKRVMDSAYRATKVSFDIVDRLLSQKKAEKSNH